MLEIIRPVTKKLIISTFKLTDQDMLRVSIDLDELKKEAQNLGFEEIIDFKDLYEAHEYTKSLEKIL